MVCLPTQFLNAKSSLRCGGAPSGEQRGARLGELHIGPALVQPEPAIGDDALKPGLVLSGRALELIDERPVDLLARAAWSEPQGYTLSLS